MKKIIIILALILKAKIIYSQTVFQKTIQVPISLAYVGGQVTSDGGYIAAGCMTPFPGEHIYLLKTDSSGSVEWLKKYAGNYSDFSVSVQQTAEGGYIIAGSTAISSAANSDKVLLIKTDSNGDTLWTRSYGSSNYNWFATSVRQCSDHGYIIAIGGTNGNTDGEGLMRTDSIGNLLLTTIYTGNPDNFDKILPASDGGFIYLLTASNSFMKTDSYGGSWWIKNFTCLLGTIQLLNVATTNDNGYIFTGFYHHAGGSDGIYLFKTDSLGDTLWTKAYNVPNYSWYSTGWSVQQTSDGGYVVSGNLTDTVQSDVFILKTDSTGNVLWMKKYGGSVGDEASYIQELNSGGFFVAGTSASFGSAFRDIYFIKTDNSGNSGCNESTLNPVILVPGISISTGSGSFIESLTAGSPLIMVDTIVQLQNTLCSSSVNIENFSINDIKSKIFPNPFAGEITIDIEKENVRQALFSVYDIFGQLLFNQQENNLSNTHIKTFDLSFLSKGIYLIVIDIDGERLVKKIVKD